MRVVIDTNVYISSLLFKGKAREVYDTCITNTDVFISDFIIAELSDKLYSKFSLSTKTIKDIITSILAVADKAVLVSPLPTICRDKDDNHILQLCESVSAEYLITGDKDLLIIVNYKSTRILSPSDFLRLYH